jgi:hypothetical protein
MASRTILLIVLLVASSIARANPPEPRVIKDAETGVIYYLESDMSHVVAITPKGALLWSHDTGVAKRGDAVIALAFGANPRNHNEGCIVLGIQRPGRDGETVWLRRTDGTIAFGMSDGEVME